ncbi:FAD-binding oxidoreductase [Nesterenkonia sp. MY13]|uniref:FAD-binding oxidoreductase n=1 Tax=Nesterenkonia sedimenti TaxID=1463632 RepID=A0A7X8TIF9_9MICC|nr:FAD-binding and (Fe-S)-binding domain-containing protein [Nesterenkonia sedimenti]NLS09357.1 FAD-binding oxidoreductase [Nesterenkonia sedimenti]
MTITADTRTNADATDLVSALRRAGVSEVDDSALARGMYSADASLYRVVPQVVARPQHVDELHAAHEVSRELGVPLTMRGAGTSIAGNAVGEGIVLDTRDLKRIIEIDPEAQTARIEPGVVHADLQRAAAPHGLRFGPDPSTHSRCTIGGMIGNNACGSRALGYGRTADNIEAATVLFGNGETGNFDARSGKATGPTAEKLLQLAQNNLAHIRTHFGQFGRQVSGYSLEHLLPENRGRIERFMAGTEGTLGTILEATVDLVRDDPGRRLLVLGFPTVAEAADAVPHILEAGKGRLIACEGMDSRLVALVRGAGKRVPTLPKGESWLFVEVAGEDALDVLDRVKSASDAVGDRLIEDATEAAALWKIREDGAGLAGISLPTPAHSGWEDAAVPPEHLGNWMREFEGLMAEFGLQGYPYGHFGDGCIHCRIDFPFQHGDPSSTSVFREFMAASAERLAEYGGSLSGEHGDGRVRSELLPTMYGEDSIALFAQAKHICDPENLLNPGIITAPDDSGPVSHTENIKPVQPKQELPWPGLLMSHDAGDFGAAVHRCSGVGRCVAPKTNGVMCPSYLATRDEKDSTRGRGRILQEAMDGTLVKGLADPAVHEALDLCLACKGCASDCPAGVDMATYKAEALYQTYDRDAEGQPKRKLRPRSHYILGRLPFWAKLAAPLAPLANLTMKLPPVAGIAKWVAGIDQRRSVPTFANKTLRRSEKKAENATSSSTPDVWVWADSFTNHFFPGSGHGALEFLRSQGLNVQVIQKQGCCGLPWITTGQLDQAKERMEQAITTLEPYVTSGVPVIGLEPSCTATLRSDAVELSPREEAKTVADGVLTFAELVNRLVDEGKVELPDLSDIDVVAQPHCHQSSIIGWDVDQALLEMAGAKVTKVAGCCGLAGNFGVEKGHYEVSVAVAETHLLPAVREQAERDDSGRTKVVLADGMSCKVQLDDLADVQAMHLAELLASRSEGQG